MADDIRDAKLVLRADDQATKTFVQVSKAIKDVTVNLNDQAKAAKDGNGSLSDLTASLKEIEKAGKDLNAQKSAITSFENTSKKADEAAAKLAKVTKAYDDYKTKIGATPTDAQSTTLGNKGDSVERAQANLDKQTAAMERARSRVSALGLSADDATAQLHGIADEFAKLPPLLVTATKAIDEFAVDQARAAAEARAASEAQTEAARTLDREAAVAAAAQKQRTASLLAGSSELLSGNRALEESFALLNAEIAGGTKASAFKQAGEDAVAAATNLNRFAQTGEAANMSLSRLAEGIRAIVTPTLAEVQTLDGAIKQIDDSAGVAADKQKLRISQYQDALNQVQQANAGLVRQAGNVEALSKQSVALDKLEAALGQAATKVEQLGLELQKAGPDADRLASELVKARAELERVGASTQTARKAFVDQSNALKAAGIDVNDLAGSYARIESAARTGAAAAETLTAKVGGGGKGFLGLKPYELQNLSYQVNDVVTSLASGISPTQTLAQQGGQIAQIFPGVLQTVIRFLPVIAAASAAIGLFAYNLAESKKAADALRGFDAEFRLYANAAQYSAKQFAEAQIALERVGVSADDAKKTLREFADANLNPAGLDSFLTTVRNIAAATGEDVPTAAQKYGDALSKGYEATATLNDITHALTNAQLDQVKALFDAGKAVEARTLVDEIYRAKSQGIADAARSDWTAAVQRLGTAFRDLNDTLGASVAASFVFKTAVDNITRDLGRIKTVVDVAKGALAALYDFKAKGEARFNSIGGTDANAAAALKAARAKYGLDDSGNFASTAPPKPRSGNPVSNDPNRPRTAATAQLLDDQEKQIRRRRLTSDQARLQQVTDDANQSANAANANEADRAQIVLNARKLEQGRIDKENAAAAKRANAEQERAERQAEEAARKAQERLNKIAELQKGLDSTFDSLSTDKQSDPFKEIDVKADKAIRDIQDKFRKLNLLGISTDDQGRTLKDYLAQVEANRQLQIQQETQKENETAVNQLLEQRKTILAAIEDKVKGGELSPIQGLDASAATLADINPRIAAAAQKALAFAQGLKLVGTEAAKNATFITSLGATLSSTQGNKAIVGIGLNDLKAAQTELDALVARRDGVVQLQDALVKVGAKTTPDAQKAIEAAFTETRPGILSAADAVQKIIDRLSAIPGISDEVKAALAKAAGGLQVTRAQTKQLTADQVALRGAVEQALSQSIGTFIDTIGSTIANVIDGTASLKDALSSIANAALSFAASFTKAIAQAIIQLIALKVAKAALNSISFLGGGFHAGGVIGSSAPTFKREVSPLAFLGAVRYHTGGLVGLRPDETPAILQKGEEVITAQDRRHRNNGGLNGGGSAAPTQVKIINYTDHGDALAAGANTNVGEKAILNLITRNSTQIKASLG